MLPAMRRRRARYGMAVQRGTPFSARHRRATMPCLFRAIECSLRERDVCGTREVREQMLMRKSVTLFDARQQMFDQRLLLLCSAPPLLPRRCFCVRHATMARYGAARRQRCDVQPRPDIAIPPSGAQCGSEQRTPA